MAKSFMTDTGAGNGEDNVDALLEKYDGYIVTLARKQVPRTMVHPEILGDLVDELAQEARIKFWQTTQKKHLTNPRPYIKCIVRSESIDMIRRYKHMLPLPVDEDGELRQGNLMVTPGEGMQDPADEFEREEVAAECLTEAVKVIVTRLPAQQQRAMICWLKDSIDDLRKLKDAFQRHNVDIDLVNWPEAKKERHNLYSSLSVAWKKLRTEERKSKGWVR